MADLQWIEGDVPTPEGTIHVLCSTKKIRVKSDSGTCIMRFKSLSKPSCKTSAIKVIGDNRYEITILKDQDIVVKYKNAE